MAGRTPAPAGPCKELLLDADSQTPERPTVLPNGLPPSFHLLAKPTGSACNLDCAYCFFLEKEQLYPDAKPRMSDETLELYVRQLVESHRTPEVTIAWQGGEPTLMGLEFFQRAVELGKKYARPDQTVVHTIQTNGTKINGDWARFFAENGFLVGLSIDGPRELHDAYRRDKAGKPTFDKVMRGLAALREHGVDWNALTTVNAANEEHPAEVYGFLRDECGSEFVQFIPIVERPCEDGVPYGAEVTDRSVSPRVGVSSSSACSTSGCGATSAGCSCSCSTSRSPTGTASRPASACTPPPAGRRSPWSSTATCTPATTSSSRSTCAGTSTTSTSRTWSPPPTQLRFGDGKQKALPRYCRECDVRFACHGGCIKDRIARTPDDEPGLNYLCPGYKAFFHHVDAPMKRMCELLRQERAPADIVAEYRATE